MKVVFWVFFRIFYFRIFQQQRGERPEKLFKTSTDDQGMLNKVIYMPNMKAVSFDNVMLRATDADSCKHHTMFIDFHFKK